MPDTGSEVSDGAGIASARVGTVLAGKWRLDALIGVGGTSAVYAGTHRNGNRAAIKIIRAPLAGSNRPRARLLREARVANALASHGAVPVVDDGIDGDDVFLVMELLQGETLAARVRAAGGRIALAEGLRIAEGMLEILAAAHARGIFHRDVKPENVFLCVGGAVRMLDFGLAYVDEPDPQSPPLTRSGTALGTPAFMAPEQAQGRARDITAATDVWGAGATLFAVITGRYVHLGETVAETLFLAGSRAAPPVAAVVPVIPAVVARVIDRALCFERDERFADAAAMLAALRAALRALDAGDDAPAARPASAETIEDEVPPLALTPRRVRQRAFAMIGLLAVAVVGGLLVSRTARTHAVDAEAGGVVVPAVHARYGGGRVLTKATSLVAVYWGALDAGVEDLEGDIEPLFPELCGTSVVEPITQYYGEVDGGRVPIASPCFRWTSTSTNDPAQGGLADPNAFVEQIAHDGNPDTIYVIFFPADAHLCAGAGGCHGTTPNLHLPYVRVPYAHADSISLTEVMFRELVDEITDPDGDGSGWSVPYGGKTYPLGSLCAPGNGGGGLGSEVVMRLWDSRAPANPMARWYPFGSFGIFSDLSNGSKGACVGALARRAVLAAVSPDGGTTAVALIGDEIRDGGLTLKAKSPGPIWSTNNVSAAAGPLGLMWHGFWTMLPAGEGNILEVWPISRDWALQTNLATVQMDSTSTVPSSIDVAMQGEGRWDAFVVGSAPGRGDASVATPPRLFHIYYDTALPDATGWDSLGDATGVTGISRLVSGPTVTSFTPGRVDAFVLGAYQDGTNHLLHAWCDDTDRGRPNDHRACTDASDYFWGDFGAPGDGAVLIGDPDVGSWHASSTGDMEIVCTASDGTLRYLPCVGTSPIASGWATLRSPPDVSFARSPTIAGMGDHRYLIAATATDGAVWQWLDDWGHGSWTRSPSLPFAPVAIDMAAY